VRDQLPLWMVDKSYRYTEELALMILIISLIINYNTFTITLGVFPSILMVSYGMQSFGGKSF